MSGTSTYSCPLCGKPFDELSNFERHLLRDHFIGMPAYYEQRFLREHQQERCCRCGKEVYPMTYIIPSMYQLPCWECSSRNRREKGQAVENIKSAIVEYYGSILVDRYLQMFLVSDVYFNSTPYHDYEGFKEVLREVNKLDRNTIWFLDWHSGYPRTISLDNLAGIKVVSIDSYYNVTSDKDKIDINYRSVIMPEITPFDQRHHSRYNILNTSTDNTRSTKKLRLRNEEDRCIKFFSIPGTEDYKSLFRIINNTRRGEDEKSNYINPLSLTEQDLTVMKLVLMRNKGFMRLICSMVGELINNIGVFSDSVFLKNTITIDPDKADIKINISWLPNSYKEGFINISIL